MSIFARTRVPFNLPALRDDSPPRRMMTDRRTFLRAILGGSIALTASASTASATPITDAYRRMVQAQREVLRILGLPNSPEQEEALGRAQDRETEANYELVALIAEAESFPIGRELTDEQEESSQEPVAVHREGDKLFMLVGADSGSIGTCGIRRSGRRNYFFRPVVVDLRATGRIGKHPQLGVCVGQAVKN